MNTIIYLYEHRDAEWFVTDKWLEKDYCLIRLGVPRLLWECLKESKERQDIPTAGRKGWFPFRRKKQEKQDEPDRGIREELKELQIALILLGDNPYWTYCVYDEALKGRIADSEWRSYWRIPEFVSYRERIWVQKLLPYAKWTQYIILGYADCMPHILCEKVAQLRSVKWYLRPEEDTPELQEFVEDFYEESGLAIEIHVVKEGWCRVHPASVCPVTVFDFSGEEKLFACDVQDGSIWLDMDSVDGKGRRIEVRNPQITYISVKKLWKQRQKEGICLDTNNKNGYNTIVK